MSQWQPIETAPKKTDEILGARYEDGEWEMRVMFWTGASWWLEVNEGGQNERCFRFHPTHWMPLPDPPPPSVTKYVPTAPYDGTRQEDQG